MHFVTDLHLHSKYSRAVSPQMTLSQMSAYARQKGIDILSASDFTHPSWFKEIRTQLIEAEEGMYMLKDESQQGKPVRFMFSTEISSIYKQGDKLRRIHNLVFAPSIEVAEKITQELLQRGCNLRADGRPIVGLSSKNLLELILAIDERAMLIPCHIWTPHFGIYGSASGFDSLDEAFGELAPFVYGIETGLSSDPDMNWQTTELMHRSILSFSDAHSLPKMSREATVFDLESPTYENLRQAIMRPSVIASEQRERSNLSEGIASSPLASRNDVNRIAYTLEFYPEEGKYHFSGHRNCKIVYKPEDVSAKGTTCPACKRRLTEGVFMRVAQLSDPKHMNRATDAINEHGLKWYTDTLGLQPPYVKLVPLLEIAAESLGSSVASQKSNLLYARLCRELTSELHVLLHAPIEDVRQVGGEKVAEGVYKVRAGTIAIDPGYDGIFGKVRIWDQTEERLSKQPVPQLRLDI